MGRWLLPAAAAVKLVAGWAVPRLTGWVRPPAALVTLLDDQPAFDQVLTAVAAHLTVLLPVHEAAELVGQGRRVGQVLRSPALAV